jgi:hypothetical protein
LFGITVARYQPCQFVIPAEPRSGESRNPVTTDARLLDSGFAGFARAPE